MTDNVIVASQEKSGLPLLSDDYLNLSETARFFDSSLDGIKEVIQHRAYAFSQKKEKLDEYLQSQLTRLKASEEEFRKKCEQLEEKIEESKNRLMQIEHSFFDIRTKLDSEKEINQNLKDAISFLQLDEGQRRSHFKKTEENYLACIGFYEKYLNINVNIDGVDKETIIITVTFKGHHKNLNCNPYVKFQMLDKKKLKVLKMYPSLEDKENMKEILEEHEIVLFINTFRKNFLSLNKCKDNS